MSAEPWAPKISQAPGQSHRHRRLARLVLSLLTSTGVLLSSTVAAEQRVFGISLQEPVPEHVLAASMAVAPSPLLLTNAPPIPQKDAASSDKTAQGWNAAGSWWYAQPQQLPKRLRGRKVRLRLAKHHQQLPFWLQLQVDSGDCAGDVQWLQQAFQARYPKARWQDPSAPNIAAETAEPQATATPSLSHRLQADDLDMAFRCERQLLLEYRSTSGLDLAFAGHRAQQESVVAQASIVRDHLKRQTMELIVGDRYNLTELFGLSLAADGLLQQTAGIEQPLALERVSPIDPAQEPLLQDATMQISVDTHGALLKLQVQWPDPDGHRFEHWNQLLRARFETPTKDRPQHQIYQFGSQRLVLRHQTQQMRLVYLDRARQRKEQIAARERERLQFEADTEGL